LRCQSNRSAAYSSTLAPIPTPATSSGRTSTDRSTIRPNPPTTEQPDGVSPTDITAGGANPECYARTDTGPRWGHNREEQWGQFRGSGPHFVIVSAPACHAVSDRAVVIMSRV
jgi:hypothetical protein